MMQAVVKADEFKYQGSNIQSNGQCTREVEMSFRGEL